jgi:hypothetical protein
MDIVEVLQGMASKVNGEGEETWCPVGVAECVYL